MRVGHLRPNYAERRLVIRQVSGVDYVEVDDRTRRASYLAARMNALAGRRLVSTTTVDNLFCAARLRDVSLLHLVNAVSVGPTPWVSTFETIVPRFEHNLVHSLPEPDFGAKAGGLLNRLAMRAMAHPRCLGLVSLSACARAIEDDFLGHFGRRGDQVRAKLLVLHPPQRVNAPSDGIRERVSGSPLRLSFVGASFVRKGGRELLDALRHLRDVQGLKDFHLTVVSAMNVDPYATCETAPEMADIRRRMAADADWITWHPSLPNDQVLALMRNTDVGLLPTHADTYGYTVLEFQSCGVPVVTTDVRAMPEINADACGWLIRVARNRLGEARYDTAAARAARATEIREGLIAVLGDIFRDPGAIARKGAAALARIRQSHDPTDYGEKLREVYAAAKGLKGEKGAP